MQEFKAGDFATRSDLEAAVRRKFDLTPETKDAVINGTAEELTRLGLSDKRVFWGIRCVVTTPVPEKKKNTESRGKPQKFGINGRTTKPKKK